MQHVNPYIQPAGDSGARVNLQHPLGHGCVGWWEMNVGSGLVVPDISGQNNHGTMTNMDAATDWVQGRYGGEGALEFDGVNENYVDVEHITPAIITFSAWVMRTGPGSDFARIHSSGGVPHWTLELDIHEDDYLSIYLQFTDGTHTGWQQILNPFGNDVWRHIAVTWDADYLRVYVDGVEEFADNAWSGKTIRQGKSYFGAPGFGIRVDYLEARIGQTSIYSRALPAKEIAHLYAEPYAPIWTPGERSAFDWFASGVEYVLSLQAEAPGARTTIFPVVVFSPTPDNSATATPQQCNFELVYNEGVSVTLTAPSSDPPGYRWDGWWNSDGRIQWPKEYVFSLTDSRVVIAHYIHSHDGVR